MKYLALALMLACGGSDSSSESPSSTSPSSTSEATSGDDMASSTSSSSTPSSSEDPDCHAEMPAAAVRTRVADLRERLMACHARLASAATVRLDVTMTIAPTGVVSDVESTVRTEQSQPFDEGPALRGCIEDVFRGMDFGMVGPDCAQVRIPLVFVPQSTPPDEAG